MEHAPGAQSLRSRPKCVETREIDLGVELHSSLPMNACASVLWHPETAPQPSPARRSVVSALFRAWDNQSTMSKPWTSLRSPQWKATAIAAFLLLLALLTWITSPRATVAHNVLHHLNFLPFMLAGMFFGWRGALKAMLLAAVTQAPSIARHWQHWPLDAKDQIVELAIFGAAGLIAGLLSDRERVQRLRVEITKLELEHVYTELRENIEQMKKSERLSAAGQLAASLAHEIRNPLASISGAAGILKRGHASPANTDECLGILEKESQRLNKLLTNFLEFARPRLPRYTRVAPAVIVESVAALARHGAMLRDVRLVADPIPPLPEIDCDAEQLKQVLLNLILNAAQATPEHGTIHIRAFAANDRLHIEVEDRGRGLSPSERDKIFDPFFTTKESGTGLGLPIAANIIAQHGGSLTGSNNIPAPGATFRIELPFSRPPARSPFNSTDRARESAIPMPAQATSPDPVPHARPVR